MEPGKRGGGRGEQGGEGRGGAMGGGPGQGGGTARAKAWWDQARTLDFTPSGEKTIVERGI